MDVNETLRTMRKLVSDTNLTPSYEDAARIGTELADAFEALDEWLSKGGFLPSDWNANRLPLKRGE